jgi:hypothetical protein
VQSFHKVSKKLILLFSLLLFGEAKYWNYEFDFSLKKGEVKEFKVFDPVREKVFKFHWNLYINGGLVTISNYDGYPYQHILYLQYNRNSFQRKLHGRQSLLMVEFKEYIPEEKKANFKLLVKNSAVEEVTKDWLSNEE